MAKLTRSGPIYAFNLKSNWIYCWIKCLREPIQKSPVLTDLLITFLCICFCAIFGYTVLILRIPSGPVHRHISQPLKKHFHNASVFRRNPVVPLLTRHQQRVGRNGKNLKLDILGKHSHPRGRALLHKSRSFQTHDVYSGFVNRFIASQNTSQRGRYFKHLQSKNKIQVCENKNNDSQVDLFILIFSHCNAKQNRDVLRQTWLTYSKNNTANIRYLFLVGEGSEMQKVNAKMEGETYNDILIGNFQDTYKNLTLKTIMGLKWVVQHCNRSKFILKTDDDVWVNIPILMQRLLTFQPTTFTVGGKCQLGRPHRDINSRYYASANDYPSDVYPPFCTGTGYVTTPNIADKIVNMSATVPYFHLEDIYVAMCLTKLRISVISIPGFHNARHDFLVPKCYFKTKNVLLMHKFNSSELQDIWQASSNCTRAYLKKPLLGRKPRGRNSFKGWRGP